MSSGNETVQALREALKLSPDNVPLRQHLADTLTGLGRHDEAEQEYRQALARSPDSARLKVGLAAAFFHQGKNSQALVIVEDLLKAPEAPARAYLLHARLLFRLGEVERAVRQYREAVDLDPSAADPEFAERLGVGADPSASEVIEGRVRAAWDEAPPPLDDAVERPRVTFQDVGGMDAIKDDIRMKIIAPLTHPDLY